MSADGDPVVERARSGATRAPLAGGRWHFQHGPIDLVIGLDGEADAVDAAIARMWARFAAVLPELVDELPALRLPVLASRALRGSVAQRMAQACLPHAARFITPMAAVAGAVADELVDTVRALPGLRRAYVNNGGDIALHLAPGTHYAIGMVCEPTAGRCASPALNGSVRIDWDCGVRGVATSGWRGRSFSLGIADAVTVLAGCAAQADAAATMIANAVNVDDPAVVRAPASSLKDDTDLGERLVTTEVGRLTPAKLNRALDAGEAHARALVEAGVVVGGALVLQGQARIVAASGEIRSQLRLG